jgi:hypothetical protein
MLSSCANYTSSNQNSQTNDHLLLYHSDSPNSSSRSSSLPVFTYSSSPHLSLLSTDTNILSNDDLFLIKNN